MTKKIGGIDESLVSCFPHPYPGTGGDQWRKMETNVDEKNQKRKIVHSLLLQPEQTDLNTL